MTQLMETKVSPALIDFLKSFGIVGFNLLGAIEHVDTLKLYVDDLEKPSGVLGREDYFSYVVTDSKDFIDMMMADFFSKDGYYGFTGISTEIVKEILKRDLKEHWRNDCYLYYLPDSVELPTPDPQVESVQLEDLEEIHSHYEYQSDDSMDNIREDILKRPSSCIRIDGELASWVLIHRDDTMGIMYTKEKFRKRHLAQKLTIDLMHKVRAIGKVPYVQILTSNTASQGLAQKAGLKKVEDVVSWFGIVVGDLPLDDD